MESPEFVEAMQRPECYPHPARQIRLVETHISWVFLTGDYAYKVKKPVNLGFLDFSGLPQRKHFCEEELRLNSRLAPQLYLGVVAITRQSRGITIDGDGEILDYAVRMAQFDATQTLDLLAQRKQLDRAAIRRVGIKLADFHRALEHQVAQAEVGDPQPGTPEAVWAPIAENFAQIAPLLADAGDLDKLERVRRWSTAAFDRLEKLIGQREAGGFVRQCHGDLHLGNMLLLAADSPLNPTDKRDILFFDRIEFNPRFSCIDIAGELAFAVMDLEARELAEQANLLLNTYLEFGGDFQGLQLHNFYKVYFAVVRAKINLLQTGASDPRQVLRHAGYREFVRYLNMAVEYLRPRQPFLAITHGLSGSGKSVVAEQIASACGAIRLRSDVERKRLFGLAPHQSGDKRIYTAAASKQTFDRLEMLAAQVCGAGFPCIVDATFLKARYRRLFSSLARRLRLPFHILDCRAPEAVLKERLVARSELGDDPSEADVAVMLKQKRVRQGLTKNEAACTIAIDTTADLRLQEIVDQLGR